MDNDQIKQVRTFFEELTNFPFLLNGIGIHDKNTALEFVNSSQEEEQIYEHFLAGLIAQSDFYPINIGKWLEVARLCNYNHPAILDDSLDLIEGGPIADWYIYPRFIKWLYRNMPSKADFDLDRQDKIFLKTDIPEKEATNKSA